MLSKFTCTSYQGRLLTGFEIDRFLSNTVSKIFYIILDSQPFNCLMHTILLNSFVVLLEWQSHRCSNN